MQNQGYLQQLKEQMKVKSLELSKNKRESEQTTKQLKDLISNNRNEITALKEVIKIKDEKISHQHLTGFATHKSTTQKKRTFGHVNFNKESSGEENILPKNNSQSDCGGSSFQLQYFTLS